MKRHIFERAFVEMTIGLLTIVFVYAAISKLSELELFKIALRQAPLIKNYAKLISIAIPIAELTTVVLLVSPTTRRFGLTCSALLILSFTIYLAYVISFSPELPCRCGGIIRELSWNQHLAFNIVLFLLSIEALVLSRILNNSFIAISRSSRTPG
jgi:hypothetical protein